MSADYFCRTQCYFLLRTESAFLSLFLCYLCFVALYLKLIGPLLTKKAGLWQWVSICNTLIKCGFLISALVLGGEEKLMLIGWNHGLVKGSGRIPTGFAMARISQQKGLGIQMPSLPPLTAWMLNQEPTDSPLSCCLPTVLPQRRLFRSRGLPRPRPRCCSAITTAAG